MILNLPTHAYMHVRVYAYIVVVETVLVDSEISGWIGGLELLYM